MHVLEWLNPRETPWWIPSIGWGDKDAMEIGNSGDVPGIAGKGASAETGIVANEMGGNQFNDLTGEPSGRRGTCWRCLRGSTCGEYPPDFG